ncbi:MAG: hypothetical protein WBP58_14720 [Chitinophagaceae bacterium]
MFKKLILTIIVFLAVTGIGLVYAQTGIEQRKVSFGAGKSSTTISSSIKGEKTIDFLVTAKAGQLMSISLNGSNSANYFNVLEPGSNDVAIYNSSEGANKFSETLNVDGTYKIRVYLIRSAARRNETSKFTLTVSVTGGNISDAKVSGTNYNATGELDAALGNERVGSRKVKFGVIRRGSGNAEIHTGLEGMPKRVFVFQNGNWTCTSPNCNIQSNRANSEEWIITVNNSEKYSINNAVVYGG